MSRADDIFRKEQEIEQIDRDMRSINPALNLYKVLSDRRAKLEAEFAMMRNGGRVIIARGRAFTHPDWVIEIEAIATL